MQRQTDDAIEFLSAQMGKQVNKTMKDAVEINLSKGEIKEYVKRFNALDYEKKGFVSTNDIKNSLEVSTVISYNAKRLVSLYNKINGIYYRKYRIRNIMKILSNRPSVHYLSCESNFLTQKFWYLLKKHLSLLFRAWRKIR